MTPMRLPGLLIALCVAAMSALAVADEPWVLVDTDKHVLTVMQDGKELERFEHIAIGRGGPSTLRRKGDGSTPIGRYRIAWVNEDSPFRTFFGFDFPSPADAERGHEAGIIDDRDLARIKAAARSGQVPPQDTPLGGRLGIHGIGGGDPRMHREFNWTQGCIALTNQQVDRLARWIGKGTQVEVR